MKKVLLSLLALPAATVALEASAQQGYGAGGGVGIENRIAGLEARLNAGIQAGAIDRREERNLRRQLSELRQLEMSYSRNGLSRQERTTLQQRIRTLRDQLRMAGGSGWSNGYGWNDSDFDRYGNAYGTAYGQDQYGRQAPVQGYSYDQYGRRIQTPTVTYDQYGRAVTNNYYGQGGPYEPAPSNRSNILGGVIGGLMGGNSGGGILGNGGLRIGDVISGMVGNALSGGSNLGYRDRNDVYFRTDGQRVYEIDARTNQVIRIHPAR